MIFLTRLVMKRTREDLNQLKNAFTSKLNQFLFANLFYASFKATVLQDPNKTSQPG